MSSTTSNPHGKAKSVCASSKAAKKFPSRQILTFNATAPKESGDYTWVAELDGKGASVRICKREPAKRPQRFIEKLMVSSAPIEPLRVA